MAKKKTNGRFEAGSVRHIEDSYRELSKPTAKKPKKKKRIFLKILLILLLLLCLAAGGFAVFMHYYDGPPLYITERTPLKPGVNLSGLDLGGMNTETAIKAIEDKFGDYATKSVIVQVMDQTIEITPAESGAGLDAQAIVTEAFNYGTSAHPGLNLDHMSFMHLNEDTIRAKVDELAQYFPTEGTQASWEQVERVQDETTIQVLVIDMGTEYYDFDADAIFQMVMEAYNNHEFSVEYTCNQLNDSTVDLDAIFAETTFEAVDAVIDKKTVEVTESKVGRTFDLEAAKEALATAKRGDVLEFEYQDVKPKVSTSKLKKLLFRDKLATYTATSKNSSSNRNTNLKLACKAINGTILFPGETFSYNETVGERTAAKGYKAATSYSNGETVQTLGGGICQTSSVLYNCALLADLKIVERSPHSYASSYVPKGLDATVSWGGPDFKFKNNTNYPIRIKASAKGGSVTITLEGTDEKDYYIKMESKVLSTTKYKTKEIYVDESSGYKDGQVKTTGYTGYTAQTYKCKYDKETKKLISREKEAYSAYSKRDKVIYRISDEPASGRVDEA